MAWQQAAGREQQEKKEAGWAPCPKKQASHLQPSGNLPSKIQEATLVLPSRRAKAFPSSPGHQMEHRKKASMTCSTPASLMLEA